MDNNGTVALTKKVILTSSKPVTKEDFIKKIGEITRNIIEFLNKNGCRKIAHIKFISTTNGEDYLHYSVQDISREPKIQGILQKTFEKIKITLNIIEFGVGRDDINSKVDREIRNIQDYFSSLK
jgi:hypothetical protein